MKAIEWSRGERLGLKKVKAATMCSMEESREDSNKMKKKVTRTTEADVNFEMYEVQLKNSTSRRDNVGKDRRSSGGCLLLLAQNP